jgi:hypothetical protein
VFACPSKTDDCETPNHGYRVELKEAGVGEKKITFENKAGCSYFHSKLLESFPQLDNCGGYELMRTQHRSTLKLEVLKPRKNEGYNVFHLKDKI